MRFHTAFEKEVGAGRAPVLRVWKKIEDEAHTAVANMDKPCEQSCEQLSAKTSVKPSHRPHSGQHDIFI